MKIISKIAVITVFLATCTLSVATIIVYPFTDLVKEERFNVLIKELRCPKCQNNNLADSNSTLSVAIKDKIYEKVNAGKSDEEIISYLKDRYGDFISYRPPVKPSTTADTSSARTRARWCPPSFRTAIPRGLNWRWRR